MINARFAAPLDRRIVELVDQGKRMVTVEDHQVTGGFGSALLEAVSTSPSCSGGRQMVRVMGGPRSFIGHHARRQQLMQAGLNADEIIKTAKAMFGAHRQEQSDVDQRSVVQVGYSW